MFTSVDEPFLFTSCIKFGLLNMPFLIMEYNIINYFRFVKCFFLKIFLITTNHRRKPINTISIHNCIIVFSTQVFCSCVEVYTISNIKLNPNLKYYEQKIEFLTYCKFQDQEMYITPSDSCLKCKFYLRLLKMYN